MMDSILWPHLYIEKDPDGVQSFVKQWLSEARSACGSSIPGCPGVHSSICNKCPLNTSSVPFYPKISLKLMRIIKRPLSVLTTNLLAKSRSPYQTEHYMTVNAFIFNVFSFVFAV